MPTQLSLGPRSPKDSYKELLRVSNIGSGVDETLRSVEDGSGASTPLKLSLTDVAIHGLAFPSSGASVGQVLAVAAGGTTMEWVTVSGGASLPSQTGQSGKFLTTNGTTASWSTKTAITLQFTPAGTLVATNVQAALEELDTKKGSLTTANNWTQAQTVKAIHGTRALGIGGGINLSLSNYFIQTVSGPMTLSVNNVPSAGNVVSFILDLTNAGTNITWFANIKWAGGTVPTLTGTGRDILGFITHDGGASWIGVLVAKDAK